MATSVNIRQLIETSAVLSEAERKEWLDLLPFMNDKQQSELLLILQPAPPPTLTKAELPASPPANGVAAASSPPVAPAPAPVAGLVAAKPAQVQSEVATTVSDFLHRNFASELHHGSVPGTFKPDTTSTPLPSAPKTEQVASSPVQKAVESPASAPAPAVAPAATTSTALPPVGVVPEQKPSATLVTPISSKKAGDLPVAASGVQSDPAAFTPAEPVISVQSLESVRMLNVATLRGSGVVSLEAQLKALCQKFGYFSVQFAFEQSPLYQAYIAVGTRILQEHHTFEEVQAVLASAGRPYLTKPEFEEFSDLIRRLKGHA